LQCNTEGVSISNKKERNGEARIIVADTKLGDSDEEGSFGKRYDR
jgi:hypothetical protein